jgi:predicted nucleotidyltransferase
VTTIKTRIDSYFADVTEKKLFGSYVRETILPRKADSNSDVDLMVVFSNPNDINLRAF